MIQLLSPANEVWGKVMLSQVFVCPQWGKGVCLGDRYPGGLPGRGSAYMGGSSWGGGRSADVSASGGSGICIQGGLGRPPGTRKAGGTHPTGILSCLLSALHKVVLCVKE